MRRAISISILAGIAACSPSGEKKRGDPTAAEAAEKAEDAAENPDEAAVRACFDRLAAALVAFDKDAVIAEITGDKDEMRSAVFFVDYLVAGHTFEQAFRTTHGDEAWDAFNDAEGASVQVSLPIDRSAIEGAKVELDGDEARLIFGSGSGPEFRKVDGAWKLVATSVFPHDPTGKQRTAFARMAEVLVLARPQAGDPATDPEALDAELGVALKQAMAVE